MKTYKTWEVIKMLEENPKLKFESAICSYTGCLKIKNDYFRLDITNNNGKLIDSSNGSGGFNGNICIAKRWHLVQQPVAFMEAANSGRRIKHESWEYYHNLSIVIDKINNRSQERQLELLNGNWYVEEEE